MRHGRLSRLLLLGILLIVVAIQGITPDAQDLASMQSLRLFARILPGSGTLALEDEWPDDVCDPLASASTLSRLASHRLDQGDSPYFDPIIDQSQPEPINLSPFRLRFWPGHFTSFAKPLCTIGCLLC
jgi:hypothetical protein